MRLATLVSPDDWMFTLGTAGKAGWRYILERLARVGITRVYIWRPCAATIGVYLSLLS